MMRKILASLKKNANRWILGIISTSIVVGCLFALLRHYQRTGLHEDVITVLERKLLDMRFRLRGPQKPTDRIGILAMDEKSIQRFGRFPFPRRIYEQAFRNLKGLGVEWLGFDMTFSEPERPYLDEARESLRDLRALGATKGPNAALFRELDSIESLLDQSPGDRSLAKSLKQFENVVLGYFYLTGQEDAEMLGDKRFRGLAKMAETSSVQAVVMPDGYDLSSYPPALSAPALVANTSAISESAQAFGYFNNVPDSDAIVRWIELVRIIDGQLMPSLSLKTAAESLNREIVVIFDSVGVEAISLVSREDDTDVIEIPIDSYGSGRALINHRGPSATIPHFSLADAYDNTFSEDEKASLRGKTLLIGPTAIGINDQRATPFDELINGVESHAAFIDNIYRQDFLRRTVDIFRVEVLLVAVVGLLFAPLMIFGRAIFSGMAVIAFLVGYYYFDRTYWFARGTWTYMAVPYLEVLALFIATTLYKYVTEEREKKKVKGAFRYYLSPDVIDQVLDNPDSLKLGGERRELTVFFSDVRGFTTISESLTPEKLCEFMNEYFTPMTGIILKGGGVLDKYIGDAIMAFWGAPLPLPNQVDVAAASSVEMLFALDRLQEEFKKKGLPKIDIGIGLNTGMMSVGNMGSNERFCYTVMGDSVNLASRLEGLTKEYGIKVMVSEFTRAKITRKDLFLRDLDDIRVKGKNEPVNVFELMRPDLLRTEGAMRDLIGEFEKGRRAYKAQRWDEAKAAFSQCLALRPDDGPTHLYLERIESLRVENLGADWNGVYTFKHK